MTHGPVHILIGGGWNEDRDVFHVKGKGKGGKFDVDYLLRVSNLTMN